MFRTRKDPRSRRRAGYQVARTLRRQMWETARADWRRLGLGLVVHGVFGTIAVLMLTLTGSPWAAYFVAGIFVGLLPFFWHVWQVAHGFANRGMGGEAERWTAEELAKLDDRSWLVVHDLPLERGNIDHVAVGPGRIYAIETKWVSSRTRFLRGCAAQAAQRAEELEMLLADRDVPRDVIPLLVVWGPGVRDELGEKPTMLGTTRVMAGAHSSVWLEKMKGAADARELDLEARRAVTELGRAVERQSLTPGRPGAANPARQQGTQPST